MPTVLPGALIQAAIDAAATPVDGVRLVGRATLSLEPGVYAVTETIRINKCVAMPPGLTLYPSPGVDAIRVESGGAWSDIAPLFIVGSPTYHTGIGIDIQAHGVSIRRPFIREMGTGIRVYGTAGQGTNANAVQVQGAVLFGPHDVGLHIKGGDANAGTFDAIEVVGRSTTRHGVLDESFLGNLVRGLHVSTTTHEAIKVTAAANYATFEGCYIESNCGSQLGAAPKIASQPGVTWLGGNVLGHVKAGDRVGMGKSAIRFEGTTPNGDVLAVTIPHASAEAYMALIHSAPPGQVSGGVELLLRRAKGTGLVEWASRAAGALKTAWASTTNAHPEGFGLFKPGKEQ